MNWPPASPALFPIENFWVSSKEMSMLKQLFLKKYKQFHSEHDLWIAIANAAKEIDPNIIEKLASSVDEKFLKVIRLDSD